MVGLSFGDAVSLVIIGAVLMETYLAIGFS